MLADGTEHFVQKIFVSLFMLFFIEDVQDPHLTNVCITRFTTTN